MRRKIPAIILLLTGLFLARSQTVQAYIDPATTTYLIQIVSALVITLGVTAGIFFNRIRLFFLNFRVSLGRLWIRLLQKETGCLSLRTGRCGQEPMKKLTRSASCGPTGALSGSGCCPPSRPQPVFALPFSSSASSSFTRAIWKI